MNVVNVVFVLMYTAPDNETPRIASIWTDDATPRAKADRYNADKDPDWPETYTVERWAVQS